MYKIFALTMTFVLLGTGAFAGEKGDKKLSCEEREKKHMQGKAAKYRKMSDEFSQCKLSKCEEKSPEEVKSVALKEIALKKQLAPIYQEMATACEKGDKKALKAAEEKRCAIDQELDLCCKEKCLGYAKSELNRAIKEFPDSKELKDLNSKYQQDSAKYLQLVKEINAQKTESYKLENDLRKAERQIHYFKQKAKLKKMKAELENDSE
jgi:hypothetical protein